MAIIELHEFVVLGCRIYLIFCIICNRLAGGDIHFRTQNILQSICVEAIVHRDKPHMEIYYGD